MSNAIPVIHLSGSVGSLGLITLAARPLPAEQPSPGLPPDPYRGWRGTSLGVNVSIAQDTLPPSMARMLAAALVAMADEIEHRQGRPRGRTR